jgi:AcrR family transcriptional regulator
MPKIVDSQAQRRVIRRAARRVFSRRGVRGAGLVHVARLAGMARASIYHYYPDKASLVRDLVRELLREEEILFATALRDAKGNPLQRIERLAGELTELFADWAALGKMLVELWSTAAAMFKPFFRRIRRDLAELIVEGQSSGEIERELDPDAAAAAVIALIDGMLLQRMLEGAAFQEEAAIRHVLTGSVRKILRP